MPAWAQEAALTDGPSFVDVVFEVACFFGYSTEALLEVPVRRFWRMLEHMRRHREQLAEAAKEHPLAALALLLGR